MGGWVGRVHRTVEGWGRGGSPRQRCHLCGAHQPSPLPAASCLACRSPRDRGRQPHKVQRRALEEGRGDGPRAQGGRVAAAQPLVRLAAAPAPAHSSHPHPTYPPPAPPTSPLPLRLQDARSSLWVKQNRDCLEADRMRRTRAAAAAGAINLKQRCGQCKTCMNNFAGGWAGWVRAGWAGRGRRASPAARTPCRPAAKSAACCRSPPRPPAGQRRYDCLTQRMKAAALSGHAGAQVRPRC